MKSKIVKKFGNIELVLDAKQVYEGGTPAMVYTENRKYGSTIGCVCGEGVIDDYYRLTTEEFDWLCEQNDLADEFHDFHAAKDRELA